MSLIPVFLLRFALFCCLFFSFFFGAPRAFALVDDTLVLDQATQDKPVTAMKRHGRDDDDDDDEDDDDDDDEWDSGEDYSTSWYDFESSDLCDYGVGFWNGNKFFECDKNGNMGGAKPQFVGLDGGPSCQGLYFHNNNVNLLTHARLAESGGISFWYQPGKNAYKGNQTRTLFSLIDFTDSGNRRLEVMTTEAGEFQIEYRTNQSGGASIETNSLQMNVSEDDWVYVSVAWDQNAQPGSTSMVFTVREPFRRQSQSVTFENERIHSGWQRLALVDDNNLYLVLGESPVGVHSPRGIIDNLRIYNDQNPRNTINYRSDGLIQRSVEDYIADQQDFGQCGASPQIDHYELRFADQALTCEGAEVRVKACANSACSQVIEDAENVHLIPAQGWQQQPVTLSAGEGTNRFSTTQADVVELGVDSNIPVQCIDLDGQPNANCQVTFSDVGFKFDTIATQRAGEPFDARLRIVKRNTSTNACETVAAQTDAIPISFGCVDPNQCQQDITINEQTVQASGYRDVAVELNNNAFALNVNYDDVGRIRLTAEKQVRVYGQSLTLYGASNAFVVKPYQLAALPQPAAAYADTDILAKAGETFDVTLQSLNKHGDVTPNFGREQVSEALALTGISNVQRPSIDPVMGNLTIGRNAKLANHFVAQAHYSEVGVIDATLSIADGDYLGAGNVNGDGRLGRFIPHHFAINDAETGIWEACEVGGFTYMGQDFSAAISVSARNKQGDLTQNYHGELAKGSALFQLSADNSDNQQKVAGRLSVTGDIDWDRGEASYQPQLNFARTNQGPDGPFLINIGFQVDDNEQNGPFTLIERTSAGEAHPIGESQQYYGRIRLSNVIGPTHERLPIEWLAEYWSGDQFVLHQRDDCSRLSRDFNVLDANSDGDETRIVLNFAGEAGAQLDNGIERNQFDVSADTEGSALFELNVPHFLKFDWQQAGQQNPSAQAIFGQYRGNDRLIYTQEVY